MQIWPLRKTDDGRSSSRVPVDSMPRRQRPLPELVRVPVGIGIMRRISIRRIPMRRIMRSRRCTVPVGAPGSPPCYARVRHRCPGHADYVNEDRGWSVGACKAALQNPDTEDQPIGVNLWAFQLNNQILCRSAIHAEYRNGGIWGIL